MTQEARCTPSRGPVKAYLCFGYDLYWLQLVNRLPESVIERLKDFQGFQGARYEVLIAAVFARAGFEIEWIDDTKATGKHPEFIASHNKTKKKVGVETKSRRRPGAMNYIGTVTPETHLKGDVFDLYEKAIQQAPGDKLRIPLKVVSDSDMIPVTRSDAITVTIGAKRRWRSYSA